MTVEKLMEALREMPQEAPVLINGRDGKLRPLKDVDDDGQGYVVLFDSE